MPASRGKKIAVIGGGLGGIAAAVSLATLGHKVNLWEKNTHVGGKLNRWQAQGFSFDLGPSIYTLPQVFARLFHQAGESPDAFYQLYRVEAPQWRCFFPDAAVVHLYASGRKTVAESPVLNPGDLAGWRDFMAYSRRLYRLAEDGYFFPGLDTWTDALRHYGWWRLLREAELWSTVHGGVTRHFNNPYLQTVMDFFIKYVGSSPYDAPAILNMMPYLQFTYGLWYVPGGMFNLALGLERLLEKVGVEVHTGVEVTALKSRDGKITALETDAGDAVEAEGFVCNMEFLPAYRRLLGLTGDELRRYQRFEPSCSGLVIHLGLDRIYPQLAHHNVFFSGDPWEHYQSVFHRRELPRDPSIYLVAPTRTDPTQAPAGHDNLKILPHIPHRTDDPPGRDDYLQLREAVLDKLEGMGLDDIRKHIVTELTWTPEDIEQNYYSHRGAIYGVVANRAQNLGFKGPRHSQFFRNLYFVGGSVNPGGGMPMAVLSGLQVAELLARGLPT